MKVSEFGNVTEYSDWPGIEGVQDNEQRSFISRATVW